MPTICKFGYPICSDTSVWLAGWLAIHRTPTCLTIIRLAEMVALATKLAKCLQAKGKPPFTAIKVFRFKETWILRQ